MILEKKQTKLIVFEGIDGAGKTTQIKELVKFLGEVGLEVGVFSFPSNNMYGSQIKEVFLKKVYVRDMHGLYQMFLADIIEESKKIKNFLYGELDFIIFDRYYFSTLCYQRDFVKISDIEKISKNILKPDLLFLLDIDVKKALSRKEKDLKNKKKILSKSLRNSRSLFEKEKILKKVRKRYLDIYKTPQKESDIIFGDLLKCPKYLIKNNKNKENITKKKITSQILNKFLRVFKDIDF